MKPTLFGRAARIRNPVMRVPLVAVTFLPMFAGAAYGCLRSTGRFPSLTLAGRVYAHAIAGAFVPAIRA
jgi:hypothetical protein